MKNSPTRYGFVTKLFHWTIFLIFLNQFIVAIAMINTPQGQTTAGFTQGALYNWHKSIGLLALLVAMFRYTWRKTTPLPDWAPNLSAQKRRPSTGSRNFSISPCSSCPSAALSS